MGGGGQDWGRGRGAVPLAAVGHPPHPSSPRGDGGGGGEAGGPEAAPGALLYLQIVEDEEERLGRQPLVELHGVRVRGRHLVVVGGRRAGVPGEVLPVGGRDGQCRWAAARGLPAFSPLVDPRERLRHHITQRYCLSPCVLWGAQVKAPSDSGARPRPARQIGRASCRERVSSPV